ARQRPGEPLALEDHPGRLRALRSRPRGRARAGDRPFAPARRARRRPVCQLGIQLDGGREPLRPPRGAGARRMSAPEISIVIRVYDEAGSVREATRELRRKLDALGWDYEIVLAEN